MATIMNRNGQYIVSGLNIAHLNRNEKEILRYAISSFAFVNKLGVMVTFAQWIENIKATYEVNGRVKAVINVLAKC